MVLQVKPNTYLMKTIILLCSFLAATFTLSAQQGSWYIGGAVGYSSNTSKSPSDFKTTYTNWAFAPEAGTFLKDDIQLGAFLGIGGGTGKNDDEEFYKYSIVSPTIYARKFFKVTDEFSTFAGAYINITTGSTTDYTGAATSVSDDSGFGFRLGVGVAYALSPRFTAVGQYGLFGYQTTKHKLDGDDDGTDSSFDFGVDTVGFSSFGQSSSSGAVFNIGIYYTFKQ